MPSWICSPQKSYPKHTLFITHQAYNVHSYSSSTSKQTYMGIYIYITREGQIGRKREGDRETYIFCLACVCFRHTNDVVKVPIGRVECHNIQDDMQYATYNLRTVFIALFLGGCPSLLEWLNGRLPRPPLKSRHGLPIISHYIAWKQLFTHTLKLCWLS